jgi:Bacterial Ig domain/Secretion system C-terminal sorting domain
MKCFNIMVWLGLLIPLHGMAQAFDGRIGIGLSAFDDGAIFPDVAWEMRPFVKANGTGAASTDATGWPAEDFRAIFFDNRPLAAWQGVAQIDDPLRRVADVRGTYKLSFSGKAKLNPADGSKDFKILNEQYDPVADLTRANVQVDSSASLLSIVFSETGGKVKNIRLIRPNYPENTTQPFSTELLNYLALFNPIRYMGFVQTNNVAPKFPVRIEWKDRAVPKTTGRYTAMTGHPATPWEFVTGMSNMLGRDAWINIPIAASDDYIRQLATFFKNNLNAPIKLYVELSNEVWNNSSTSFTQGVYAHDAYMDELSKDPGTPLNKPATSDATVQIARWYARRSFEVANIFSEVFGSEFGKNVQMVYAIWTARYTNYDGYLLWLQSNYPASKGIFHVLAPSVYFGSGRDVVGGTAAATQIINTGTPQDIAKLMKDDLTGQLSRNQAIKALAVKYNLRLINYEGGNSIGAIGDRTNIANRITSNRIPDIKEAYQVLRTSWFGAGADAYLQFNAYGEFTRFGAWGLIETTDLVKPVGPKLEALCELTGTCSGRPSIQITGPSAGKIAPTTVELKVNVSDTDGSIAKVAYFDGWNKIGENTNSPFNYVWQVSNKKGVASITAKATDNQGKSTFSTTVVYEFDEQVSTNVTTSFPKNMLLYPNPSDGKYSIDYSAPTAEIIAWRLVDGNGLVLYNGTHRVEQGSNTLSHAFPHLKQGIYFLQVANKQGVLFYKKILIY